MAGLEWLWGRPSCCTFCCLDMSCSRLVLMETLRSKHGLSPKAPRKLPELGRIMSMEVYPCGAPKLLLLPRGPRIRVLSGESRVLPGAGGGETVEGSRVLAKNAGESPCHQRWRAIDDLGSWSCRTPWEMYGLEGIWLRHPHEHTKHTCYNRDIRVR